MKYKPVQIIKRGKSYQLYYYTPNGERRRITVGQDYQHAQRMVVKFSDWLLDSKDPEQEIERAKQIESSKQITLSELYPVFMERHGSKQSESMQTLYRYRFINIARCPQLAEIPIYTITKRLLLDYMEARLKQDGVSTATVNREASMIKCMLFRAIEWDMLDRNQLQGFKLLSEGPKREVKLTEEEASALINELKEPISSIVELLIYTGFRKESVLDMKIDSIQFHDITSTGEVSLNVKGGKTEKFPLGSNAVEVLKRVIGKRKSGYVFVNQRTGNRYSSIHKTFNTVVRKLGLTVIGTKLRIHDLRHANATWMHQAGIGKDIIGQLLGHKDSKTADRYITYDRMSYGVALEVIPKLERNAKKEDSSTCHAEAI
ncbi:tyrosine-type recombinase/integrase [Candidatus Latescibacterota bacterium]